jgi:hypothetical protein
MAKSYPASIDCRRALVMWIVVALLTGAAAVGCSSSEFELAPVTGQVTIDGRPFTQGKVMFAPVASGESRQAGRPAFSRLGPDGSFTLGTYESEDGAVVGEHWVTVIYIEPKDSAPSAPAPAFSRVAVPQKVTVVADQDNRIDVALTRDQIARYGMVDD